MELLHDSARAAPVRAPALPAPETAAPLAPAPVPAMGGVLAWGAQRSVEVGAADDQCEIEAERRAGEIVAALHGHQSVAPVPAASAGSINRLRRAGAPIGAAGGPVDAATQRDLAAARGGGRPLDDTLRRRLEPIMGADLSGVRLHGGAQARRLNEQVRAQAFTLGRDIFFRDGIPAPGANDHLLAHELTHTLQQDAPRSPIRRFYALVDKPKTGKKYDGAVEGKPYEWIDDAQWDAQAYRVSPLKTGWKVYNLYERVPQPQATTEEAESEEATPKTPQTSKAATQPKGPPPKGSAKKNRRRNRKPRQVVEESGEVESEELAPEPVPDEESETGENEVEQEPEPEPDDGLPKAGVKYTLVEARGKLAALHPAAPHPPINRMALAAAWGRYILDELQVSRTQEKKMKQTELANRPMPGAVRDTYKTQYDKGEEFSASVAVDNVPEIVVHVHLDPNGVPKKGKAVHWKWAGDPWEYRPESYELSAKSVARFVTVKGANKHWEKKQAAVAAAVNRT